MLHVYQSIDCSSRHRNNCEAMYGSVSLAVSISRENFVPVILSFVGCVQVSDTQNGDYLMFDDSHYLKTRAETVSTLTLHPLLILAK